ncbi:hypothetical protein ABDK69_00260 [Limosilactobacillus fermentum]|uniref:hypothetical protein n=1 Tax=Limosilactobacillus fermentum TaxID=1613 RepID=UPI003F66793E
MTAVTVAGLMVIVIWLVAFKKRPAYPQALQEGWQSYIRQGMLSGAKLAPFFIAIGYFSNAFDGSPVALALSKVVGPNLSHLSWGLLFVIPVVIVLLALLGIHPLVSITLLGQVLLTSQVTIPTLAIALALNVGGALSYLVSPFEGAIVLISDLADVPPTTVAIKYNGWFGLWFLLLSTVVIYFFAN